MVRSGAFDIEKCGGIQSVKHAVEPKNEQTMSESKVI